MYVHIHEYTYMYIYVIYSIMYQAYVYSQRTSLKVVKRSISDAAMVLALHQVAIRRPLL